MSERDWAILCLELLEGSIIDNEDEFSRDKEYMLANHPLYRFAIHKIRDELTEDEIAEYTKRFRHFSESELEVHYDINGANK